MCFPLRGGSYRGPSNYAYHTFLPTATTEQHTFLPLIHLSLFFPVDSSLVLQPVDSCSLHLFFLMSRACQRVDRTTLRNLYTIQGKQAFILSFQTLPQTGKRESSNPDTVRQVSIESFQTLDGQERVTRYCKDHVVGSPASRNTLTCLRTGPSASLDNPRLGGRSISGSRVERRI